MTSRRRDSYLDHWRGLFHVLLLADHIPLLFPGLFTLIAALFELPGYTSVAEGFVFLSGYVTGLVYTRLKQEQGERAVWRKAVVRALTIYVTYIGAIILLLLFVKWGGTLEISWGSWDHLISEPATLASAQVASLIWQPSFLEILPMYALFLVFAPIIVGQLDSGRGWLVMGVSFTLWLANLFGVHGRVLEGIAVQGENLGYFKSIAWQILFVGGAICGHKTYRTAKPWLPKHTGLSVAVYIALLVLFAHRHRVLEIPLSPWWVERSWLGPVRLLNFACIAFLAARFRGPVDNLIRSQGLAFLSRHSLQVFAFHLIPIYLAALIIAGKTRLAWWEQVMFICFCILGLFSIAWISKLVKLWFRKMASVPQIEQERIESVEAK